MIVYDGGVGYTYDGDGDADVSLSCMMVYDVQGPRLNDPWAHWS